MAGKLILCRHGQSEWNKKDLFTGWEDVDLTKQGSLEAKNAGNELSKLDYDIQIAFSSVLKRAIRTLTIILDQLDRMWIPVNRRWRLNERHYGALQGLNKTETKKKFGTEQVHIWRRSYSISPPKLELEDTRHPCHDIKYENIKDLPSGESLADTLRRVKPVWD